MGLSPPRGLRGQRRPGGADPAARAASPFPSSCKFRHRHPLGPARWPAVARRGQSREPRPPLRTLHDCADCADSDSAALGAFKLPCPVPASVTDSDRQPWKSWYRDSDLISPSRGPLPAPRTPTPTPCSTHTVIRPAAEPTHPVGARAHAHMITRRARAYTPEQCGSQIHKTRVIANSLNPGTLRTTTTTYWGAHWAGRKVEERL